MRRTLELKRVDIGSLFKVAFVLYAVLGLVAGLMVALVFMMVGSLGSLLADEVPGFGMLTGVAGMAMIPVMSMMYGIMGSIVVTIIGLLYNLAAGRVGGIKLEFEPKETSPGMMPTAAAPPPQTY